MKRLAALAVAVTGLALASTAFATHSWGGYHWARTSNPFTLKLGDNLSSGWKPYLATTSSDWSANPSVIYPGAGIVQVLQTTIVPGSSFKKRCGAVSGRVEVCNGSYGNNGWLGLAQIWLSGGHISQGTVKVNDTYFNLAQYNNPAEKNHVMCQEVGHTFGLDHQDTSGASLQTCMDYSSDPSSQHPNKHDYEELGIIYAHLDSTTTVSAAATSPGNGKAQRVRDDLWVEDLGNGVRKFTFVYWVDRHATHGAPQVGD